MVIYGTGIDIFQGHKKLREISGPHPNRKYERDSLIEIKFIAGYGLPGLGEHTEITIYDPEEFLP